MKQKIKKMLINENGSITLLVLSAMIFMIVILALSFTDVTNKISAQRKEIKRIESQYAEGDLDQKYQEAIEQQTDKE